MSTAVAMAPSPAPHDRPSFNTERPPVTTSPTAQKTTAAPPPPYTAPNANAPAPTPRSGSGSPRGSVATASTHKPSPPSASRNPGGPKILVKKEPGSPGLPTGRHRPRRLDLSKNTNIVSPATARPLTARDGGLGIQEVGLACLSPGFVTHDPIMKEQVQRSITLKEQQRQIIEARLHQQSAKGDGPDRDQRGPFAAKTPGFARKRGAPPGLSIVAPSHEQFANERVIQSAPLGQTFTGRYNPHPHQLTRHIANQPSNLGHTSHIHHAPANQTINRLPPIADVFGPRGSGHPESSGHALFASQNRGPLASPHHPPPPPQAPTPGRPREYKSAEEAQAEMAGGRPELLPKLVRYGAMQQPPTPPSPPHARDPRDQHVPSHHHHPHDHNHNHNNNHTQRPPFADSVPTTSSRSASGSNHNSNHNNNAAPASASANAPVPPPLMKRRRAEYEDGGSPPLGNGRAAQQPRRAGPFGEGRDSPETQEAKREEFLRICERAWDLFHS